MNIFIVQFFVWWYSVKVSGYIAFVRFVFLYLMITTRGLPMWQNLNKPFFGDTSIWGRGIGIVIRFWWAMFATLISMIIVFPLAAFSVVVVLIPVLPFVHLIYILI